MNRLLGSLILSVSLVVPVSSALASVPISCAPGVPPVQSEGIQIDGGTIEILDDACRPPQGSEIPPALAVVNIAATPAAVNAGQALTYSATVNNVQTQTVPGVTYDSCSLDVLRPGGQLDHNIAIPALTAAVSLPVTIPANGVAGTWQLALKCRRFVAGQEIIVPAILAANVQVTSNTPPTGCENIEAPFAAGGVESWDQFFGVPFGANQNVWRWGFTGNEYSPANQFLRARVRSIKFVAPASGSKKINFPSSTGGVMATISQQCGDMNAAPACTGVASSAIKWSTSAGPGICSLEPGQTYYLNFAWIKAYDYQTSGNVVPTCVCPGPTCTNQGSVNVASCQFGANVTNP